MMMIVLMMVTRPSWCRGGSGWWWSKRGRGASTGRTRSSPRRTSSLSDTTQEVNVKTWQAGSLLQPISMGSSMKLNINQRRTQGQAAQSQWNNTFRWNKSLWGLIGKDIQGRGEKNKQCSIACNYWRGWDRKDRHEMASLIFTFGQKLQRWILDWWEKLARQVLSSQL